LRAVLVVSLAAAAAAAAAAALVGAWGSISMSELVFFLSSVSLWVDGIGIVFGWFFCFCLFVCVAVALRTYPLGVFALEKDEAGKAFLFSCPYMNTFMHKKSHSSTFRSIQTQCTLNHPFSFRHHPLLFGFLFLLAAFPPLFPL